MIVDHENQARNSPIFTGGVLLLPHFEQFSPDVNGTYKIVQFETKIFHKGCRLEL